MTVKRPRRNRVTPFGEIERTPHRGMMLGNRGILSGNDGEVARSFQPLRKGWIICVLDAGDGHNVTFDSPNAYSPLFALDEATFLAAGHRPCARCRPEAFTLFKAAWARAHNLPPEQLLKATDIDAQLHLARLDRHGRQRTHRARYGDLPNGVFCRMPAIGPDCPSLAVLKWGLQGYPWLHEGYGPPVTVPPSLLVDVLTPSPTVAVLKAGYVPETAQSRMTNRPRTFTCLGRASSGSTT